MTDANELYESVTRELNNEVICDTGEIKDEHERFSFHRETVPDDIPPSLLSYFEASKSRAAVCETFILEEVEDLTASHHSEDMMNFPSELNKDMMKPNKQVVSCCETEYEESSSSAETHLVLTPTEAEAFFTRSVSLCPNNKDEAETDEYMGSDEYLEFEVMTLESSMKEEEIKKSNEYRREHRERRHCEEMKKEERRRQKERDFQEELKKIMEAEKLQQRELELMRMRAQERLEQEFRLQQELISNLQKRVEEERKMREEEQKRIKEEGERKRQEEEEKRKREKEEDSRKREEAIKREMERKRMEEETRKKKAEEEKRKIEEIRVQEKHRRKKEEQQRKKEEEEKRRLENEEKRKREEERNKMEEDSRKKEEERKIKEILKEERLKEEEKRQVEEEERKGRENEEKIKGREKNRKKEDEKTRKSKEEKTMIEVARKKIEEDKRRKNEEEIEVEEGKKEKEEGRNTDDKDKRREEDVRTTTEPEVRVKHDEMRKKEEETKSEEETRKAEVEKKMMVKQMKREEEEKRKLEEMQLKQDLENGNKDEERRHSMECKDIWMEERRKWHEEEMRRQKEEEEEEEYGNMGEEIWNQACEAESRAMEHERKTKDKEKMQGEVNRKQEEDDLRKREDGKWNIEADKRQIKEDMSKNRAENEGAEEESNNIMVRAPEREEKLVGANEPQEQKRRNDSMKTHNESMDTDDTANHLTSPLEDSSTLTTSDPAPLHSESTVSPTSSEAVQRDLNQDISQTSTCATEERPGAAAKPCASSRPLPACLPDNTEQKRLSWMNDCIPWSKLSLQSKRKQREGVRSRRGPRKSEAGSLPPLCPHALLQSVGCRSLHEVTSVTLEDLPGCSLSTLAQCTRLQSLTLRRCGIKSLEGISRLPQLGYIDVQENAISFVDCENMTSLRVLRLGRNELTSIHGLSGAENLDALDLSHNSITRIAGLESMRRLQRLSVAHNQLISTKGLRDVYTLLHLDCSHNHLVAVEGLENSALLQSLDLRANSLTEPPGLNNHVLLRELHLDDNSISSLQGLVICWLPLMHHLSVAQNRITLLPSMSDFVSLANLDLRFNCMSELQNVCESLEGCQLLREVHLTGNPLQQESGWRSTLQKAAVGLRAIDGQETDFILSAPAVQQDSSASGSFLTFCQAQLKQTRDLQQQHSRDLSDASSPLDAVKSSCRHFTETLKLAVDQRFAHEYGDTTVSAGQTTPENTLDLDVTNAGKHAGHSEMESKEKVPPVIPSRSDINGSYWTEEKSSTESWRDTLDTVTTALKTGHHSPALKGKSASSPLEVAPVSNHQDLILKKSTAAVVIQQQWRKYRQKCGNISSAPTAETGGGRGGDGGKPESGPSYIDGVIGQDYAATVIQASWRGFTLRRRLASALAAVTCPDSGEDETFEEVDVDEFVFDEAAVEQHWTLLLSEDSSSRRHSVSEQPPSLKPPGPFPDSSESTLLPPPSWRPKQAWVAGEQVAPTGQRITPESSNRSKSPASTSALSGLSARSEQVLEEWGFTDSHTALLMLRRAQKMKSKKPQQRKHGDPSVCLALFRNCNYQRGPVEARNRPAPRNRNYIKVCRAELGLQQAEKTEQVEQERAEQWLHSQSDRDSESEHFLPEISSDILNGGRVQLVADPGYTERLHHASGLWASSSLAAQPSKERNYPRRNSLGYARKEAPSPQHAASAPSKKERISFRDNPVQLSGGWGGGKKRDRVYK